MVSVFCLIDNSKVQPLKSLHITITIDLSISLKTGMPIEHLSNNIDVATLKSLILLYP